MLHKPWWLANHFSLGFVILRVALSGVFDYNQSISTNKNYYCFRAELGPGSLFGGGLRWQRLI